jgi:hypothetical protein
VLDAALGQHQLAVVLARRDETDDDAVGSSTLLDVVRNRHGHVSWA